jgi:hypothetical protein
VLQLDNVLGLLLAILHAIFTSRLFWFCVAGACITAWISWVVRDAVKDAIRNLDLDERVREAVREALQESREETEDE